MTIFMLGSLTLATHYQLKRNWELEILGKFPKLIRPWNCASVAAYPCDSELMKWSSLIDLKQHTYSQINC